MAVGSRPRGTRLLVIALVSLSLATITLDYRQGERGPLAGVGRAAITVMAPLQTGVSRVTRPVGDFLSTLVHLPSVRRENERLKDELARASAQAAERASLEARLGELSALLDLAERLDPPTLAAVVIGNGVSNFEWVITVDKGTADGVQAGMPVVASAGLVGHVVRAGPVSSEVQLIIDPDSWVGARLATSRETGVLEGRGQGDLRMSLVDPSTEVAADEPVVTSGYRVRDLRSLYPPDIVIGTVSRVLENPAALEKHVTVRPAVDFSTLDFVLVVLTEASE